MSEEQKQLRSKIMRGRKREKFSKEWCENISKGHKGKAKSEKFKKEASLWMLGKQNCLGRKLSNETKSKIGKGNSKKIKQFTRENEFIREWDSATQVSRELNYSVEGVRKCCRGEAKTYKKYIWRDSNAL